MSESIYESPDELVTLLLEARSDRDHQKARAEAAEAAADEMAATVVLLAHDAHPTYASTAGWRGGIGGQALTQGCSIIDPPPGADWTQLDRPTEPARNWIRGRDIDLDAIKADLKARWTAALTDEETT